MSDSQTDLAGLSLTERAALEMRLLEGRGSGAGARRIQPRDPAATVPLSFAQQRLWFLDQLQPGSSTYNMARRIRLRGQLDTEALRRALDGMVARHEPLRTTIVALEGTPRQVIAPALSIPIPVTDLSGLPDRETRVQRLAVQEVRRPFDLARGPLLRAALFRLDPDEHLLVLTIHHIVGDGWSLGVVSRELGALYRAFSEGQPSPLPELPIQYADYTVWQRNELQGERLERELAYWRKQLEGVPPALDLPTDRPRPEVRGARGSRESILIPKQIADGLKALSQREGATLFATLLAAFHTLLARYTGAEDIVVGSPIAGRTEAETEGLVGLFVNTLALRLDLSGNPSFRELVHQAREVTLGAYSHQSLPFEKLVEELQPERDLGRTPVFQVAFAYQNAPSHKLDLPGLTLQSEPAEIGSAKFDLMLYMWQRSDGLRAVLEYNLDLFEPGTIIRMLGHFRTLLEAVALTPDRHIAELPLLSGEERRQLLVEWNATAAEVPDRTLHGLFEEQAARTPDSLAVVAGDERLTYRELDRQANRLAQALRARGVGPEARVGVCLERSHHMIVALLGILKAGGAYLPLDPEYPEERRRYILSDSRVTVLVTSDRLRESFATGEATTIVAVDRDLEPVALEAEHRGGPSNVVGDNLAYVIYTSGSTGAAKGVGVSHRNVVSFVGWARETTSAGAGERVLATTSINFDISVYEIFGTLSWGGTIVMTGGALELPSRPEIQAGGAATLLNTVPSAGAALARLNAIPPGLRRVNLGGEAVPRAVVEALYAAGVEEVYDFYGPTETTVYSTAAHIPAGGEGPPLIGRPIANTQVYVLDRAFEPVPIGVPGELYIGGAGVARGYLGRPSLTATRFMPDPFGPAAGGQSGARLYRTGDRVRWRPDGALEFLGRLDRQVKLRGYRIEPGEIEAVLARHPAVHTAVVAVREDEPGDLRLVGYVVRNGVAPSLDELRRFLERQLPEYMVPSALVVLEALPLSPNGKLDLRALPAPERETEERNDYVAPRTPIEETLAAIWTTVLRLERVGIRDNFFAIGGHSLLATQVVARVRSIMGVELPLHAMFEVPTIADLATRIGSDLLASSPQGPALTGRPRVAYREDVS